MAKTYARSEYKNPFASDVARNNAKARGWGSGWPNCQVGKMKTILVEDQTQGENFDLRITVREEVAEMVMYLLMATDKQYDLLRSETGAYNCRAIRGTNTASNHSWGLAVDINWNHNPMSSTFHSEIPPAVVAMWNACGWYWGGFYANRKDTMHFEYIGKPSDVAKHAAKAKEYALGKPVAPKPPKVDGVSTKWGAYFKGKTTTRTVKMYDRGDDVKFIQRYFGLLDPKTKDGDGYYGERTKTRVAMWQNDMGLVGDGIVGPKTWAVFKRVVKGL